MFPHEPCEWVWCVPCAQGRILMTHPTKAIFNTLLKDFVKVSKGSSDEGLYSEKDLEASLERVEVCDFHQTIDMDGIKVNGKGLPANRCGIC